MAKEDARVIKTKQKLILTLRQLLKEKNFEDITVNLICEQGGFPRKSFYRYFDNKDSALEALVAHTLQEYELFPKKIKGNRTLATDLENFFRFWLEKSDFYTAPAIYSLPYYDHLKYLAL